jgi:hypothetical protein
MYEKLIHKPNSGLDLVVRKPKIQKVKEKKKKIIIKVENKKNYDRLLDN